MVACSFGFSRGGKPSQWDSSGSTKISPVRGAGNGIARHADDGRVPVSHDAENDGVPGTYCHTP